MKKLPPTRRICEGTKQPNVVLQEQVVKYRDLFRTATQQVKKIEDSCARYLQEA